MKKIIQLVSVFGVLIGIGLIAFRVGENMPMEYTTFAQETKQQKEENKVAIALPNVKTSDWDLVLVNDTHKASEKAPELEKLSNGYELDKRVAPFWVKLNAAAEKAGHELQMVSAYRSPEEQEKIVQENIGLNMSENMSEEEAQEETMKVMTRPGYSEHNTGLALDVVGVDYYNDHLDNLLVKEYAQDASAKWLALHVSEYGFILRYPQGAQSITGINFEPWHFRYVGVENAKYITEHHLTLEEYIELLKGVGK
ncbi:D-alanyl-D-alanine carboxypeptidase [Pilibacter termitis]|uniref:D-alanyl-D-alanine carboxypeptidase n=1 Tax=Pilibacter termitis TaxID=263852 RepID=A0A1T4N845_9ENTE|nr:M15 family metallopeptidase [Pilibacter termitis]SJZ75404.1 D-alanyl-D-alanine carboxypeptidase [Pilibacter termitis]